MKIEFEIDEKIYRVWEEMKKYVEAKTGKPCLDINKFAKNCFASILLTTVKPEIFIKVTKENMKN